MSFPRVSGHPDYTRDGSSQFIPELWSGKLLVKFYDSTILSNICNTDYEGEIKKQGDRIIIRTVPTVTIRNYSKGQTLNYERLESPSLEMTIDKGKYWAFTVDRIDKYQADINMLNDWSRDASEQLKIAVDTDVLGTVYADAHADNKGTTAGRLSNNIDLGTSGSPEALTKSNILDYIINCGLVLDEQNIPEQGRFITLPPWATAMLKMSDLKDASFSNDTSVLRNGRVGMLDRFTIYNSNLIASATDGGQTCYQIMFGTKHAISFAAQLTETETLKAESTFGDLVRGLMVYGYKVIKPEALGVLYAYRG